MQEQSLFIEALEKEDPAERAAFLDRACAADPALRARIDRLLQRHQQPGGFLETPAPLSPDAAEEPIREGPGSVIGPYTLREQLGEGGFGVVFLAEQEQPLRRKVALKVLKPGMDTRAVVARFEAERQALALMDHPNIARVFDGGQTDSGRPYFVMELVKGVPITDYCDHNRLTPRERLELFVQVCQAVQHAHTKGIIHRDLKPSNVLVTVHDVTPSPYPLPLGGGEGRVRGVAKVIDFGIAKALGQRLTDKTVYTGFAQMLGTPAYMSPEQAGLSGLDVDMRSDIYSLGVLLYELLTGTTPFDPQRFRAAGFDEICRIIREEEPPPPSTRISSLGQAAASVSLQRQSDPRRLRQLLRGEPDWIVMRCLEKDRGRRYETAGALAADLQRYLRQEPVEAGPPSRLYRWRKLVRRNRGAVLAAGLVVMALLAGVVVSASFAVQADKNARDAQTKAGLAESEKVRANDNALLFARRAYLSDLRQAQQAWEQGQIHFVRELLSQQLPEQTGGADLRNFEYYYWQRLCSLDLRTLRGHTGPVLSVAFSPDGTHLASGCGGRVGKFVGEVKVWDMITGQETLTFNGHTGQITSVAYSPDGKRLASASWDRTVKVWDAATGQEILTFKGHPDIVRNAAFSPDGTRIASAGADKTVKVWDAQTGRELLSLAREKRVMNYVTFSPDGRWLVCLSQLQLVRLEGPGVAVPLEVPRGHEISVRDAQTGQESVSWKDFNQSYLTVAFSPDSNRLVGIREDGTVRFWDVPTGKERFSFPSTARSCLSLAFSPDGHRLAGACSDKTVKVWDAGTGREVLRLKGHTGPVTAVAFSPDGERLASGSVDRTAKIWSVAGSQEVLTLRQAGPEIAFSPDGRRLASGAKVWDADSGRPALPLEHSGSVSGTAFNPGGQRLAGLDADKDNSAIKIWDATSGQTLSTFKVPAGLSHLAFSPDGQRLAAGTQADGTVKVWDAVTGREVLTLKAARGRVEALCLSFSPDGRLLAAATGLEDPLVKLWDLTTGQEVLTLPLLTAGRCEAVAFSPDGTRLASGSSGRFVAPGAEVKVWDAQTGKELLTLKGHTGDVTCIAFSPDGRRLATGSFDQTVKLWDLASGQELLTFKGHTGEVRGVAFSPDGRRLASAAADNTVKVWDARPLTPERKLDQEALGLVAFLFARPVLRDEVLDRLRAHPAVSEAVRRKALTLAQTYPYDPEPFHAAAWAVVRQPGATAEQSRQALDHAQFACRLDGESLRYLITLGVAQYRAGQDREAVDTLTRAEKKTDPGDPDPAAAAVHAFRAMAHQRLGQQGQARVDLARLRWSVHPQSPWGKDPDATNFLTEAAVLIEGAAEKKPEKPPGP
jgi:WD40 repeat protein/serine/threonine protein kinase